MLGIITAAFGPHIMDTSSMKDMCSAPRTDYEELVCQWQEVSRMSISANSTDNLDTQWIPFIIKVSLNRLAALEDVAYWYLVAAESPGHHEQHGEQL